MSVIGSMRALVVAHNLNNPEGAPRYLSEIVVGLRDRGVLIEVDGMGEVDEVTERVLSALS